MAQNPTMPSRRLRDRVRMLLFFTPWVSVPLALFGIALAVIWLLTLLDSLAWILAPLAAVAAAALALWLRGRYRLAIIDSSPLGVYSWFQRR